MNLHAEQLKTEIESRRTFAIISHPDAGKTTLTEKLLLFGGAIRLAGSIKGRKTKKYAASDWMEMERQRGISITSSVLQFSYRGYRINILDTPGHQDFSEDTYRTLTAADSALMLIDMAKGVEAQTIKLFEVCRMQNIPIFTFINKLDRQGKEPLDLLDEIEKVLGIGSYPMNWPAGSAPGRHGLYDRHSHELEMHKPGEKPRIISTGKLGVEHSHCKDALDQNSYHKLRDEIGLLDAAGEPFDQKKVENSQLTPVFFGSAISGFGVASFLNEFLRLAPPPGPRKSSAGTIDPTDDPFSGFIFKIQANMNPAHRDRIAFLRICSGKFNRDMTVNHVRAEKKIKLSQPQQFLAQNRSIIEEAYPGDIIGLYDTGSYKIGDTLTEKEAFHFDKLPRFSPELFARVSARDARKYKQFHKGLSQLAEEGAVQVFTTLGAESIILGAVGELQFEVFKYRLSAEYGVEIELERLPYRLARWVKEPEIKKLPNVHGLAAKDKSGNGFIFFESEFWLKLAMEKNHLLDLRPLEQCPSA
ncbi:MAG: peptide chain release factor 3 [Bacillota bacterium]|nr:peptide chain release factor 3 [Bacillota bacterium]